MRSLATMALALAVTVPACSPPPDGELTDESSSALSSIGSNVQLTTDPDGSSETSVVAVPTNSDISSVVVGFNANHAPGAEGWAYSANGGATWVSHLSTDPGYTWPALPSPLSDGNAYVEFYSDPALAWTGYDGVVAYVAVVASTNSLDADVGLALSTDGGRTFTRTITVSDGKHVPGSAPNVDQPVAATDATNHAVWVWWRANSRSFLRPVYFSATGVSRMGSVIDITKKLPINTGLSASVNIAVKSAATVGGQPTIYLAYPDKIMERGTCGETPAPGTASVTWRFSWSTDGAQTFSTNRIVTDPQWPYCIMNQANGQNRNRPAIAFDPVSGYVARHARQL